MYHIKYADGLTIIVTVIKLPNKLISKVNALSMRASSYEWNSVIFDKQYKSISCLESW